MEPAEESTNQLLWDANEFDPAKAQEAEVAWSVSVVKWLVIVAGHARFPVSSPPFSRQSDNYISRSPKVEDVATTAKPPRRAVAATRDQQCGPLGRGRGTDRSGTTR